MGKKDHKDDLEGITLFIYENKIKSTKDDITNAIVDLLRQGLIVELKVYKKKFYQVSKDQAAVSDFLKKNRS